MRRRLAGIEASFRHHHPSTLPTNDGGVLFSKRGGDLGVAATRLQQLRQFLFWAKYTSELSPPKAMASTPGRIWQAQLVHWSDGVRNILRVQTS